MAFTGVAVITEVADGLVRITGLSLAGGASGVIALDQAATPPDVELPASFQPRPYGNVTMQDSVEVTWVPVTSITTLVPITCNKSGTNPDDFAITLANTTVGTASAQLEIYVRHH